MFYKKPKTDRIRELKMQKAFIEPEKCIHCSKCKIEAICPPRAIFCIDKEEPRIVDPNLCHGCGDCLSECPAHAVTLRNG